MKISLIKHLSCFCIFFLGLCFGPSAWAQTVPADSLLLHYRQMALDYNDNLKAASKNIAASMELQRAARADFSPKIAAGADFSYTGNALQISKDLPSIGPLSIEGKNLNYGFAATLQQPIYTGGRILAQIKLAESHQAIAGMQKELMQSLVCYQVDVQYWNTVARKEMVRVATDFRNSIARLTQTVKERVEAGLTDSQALLTAEVQLNEAEYRLLQSQSDFETGLMALNALIGVPLDTPTQVSDKVSVLPASIVSGQVGQTWDVAALRPETRMAREQVAIAQNDLKLNHSKYLPQLHVGVSGGYYAPGYDFTSDLSPNYNVYATLSVPIFEGGKRRREKKAAKQRIGMAEDRLHQQQIEVELEAQTARTAFDQAMQRVELAARSLEKAHANESQAIDKYEEGLLSITEVIDAQVYRQTAETNHVAAKAASQMHYAEWLKAVHQYKIE